MSDPENPRQLVLFEVSVHPHLRIVKDVAAVALLAEELAIAGQELPDNVIPFVRIEREYPPAA